MNYTEKLKSNLVNVLKLSSEYESSNGAKKH